MKAGFSCEKPTFMVEGGGQFAGLLLPDRPAKNGWMMSGIEQTGEGWG
jgi:hypothetical protein